MRGFLSLLRRGIAGDIEGRESSAYFPFHRFITLPLSKFFGMVVYFRNQFYEIGLLPVRRLPGFTISIGNLNVGGTGKSPVVMEVVKYLTSNGARCAILSRGYGSGMESSDSMILLNGEVIQKPKYAPRIPDEAMMQSLALPTVPVIACGKRWDAAQDFLSKHKDLAPTHWVLDDGFQHRSISRDLDIVLLDATLPFGNGKLLPRGNLREPPEALARADVVIFTRTPGLEIPQDALKELHEFYQGPTLAASFTARIRPESQNRKKLFFDHKAHQPVLAVCGIARPEIFLNQIKDQNIHVSSLYAVRDHAPIDPELLDNFVQNASSVITTAKDYCRDPAIFAQLTVPVFIQDLTLEFGGLGISAVLGPILVKRP